MRPKDDSFTLKPCVSEVVNINKTLQNNLPSNIFKDITLDDFTRRTNLTIQTTENEEKRNSITFCPLSFYEVLL